jgi:hypothetical protein
MAADKPFPRTTPATPKAGLIELRADRPFSTIRPERRNLSTPTTASFRQIRPKTHPNSCLPLTSQRIATQ